MSQTVFNPPSTKRHYTISILVDTPDSWLFPWVDRLLELLEPYHDVFLCRNNEELRKGDLAFLLGCTRILPESRLKLNTLNLVVHESDLPFGRGWSPLTWQILEGKKSIPVVLFEARQKLDAGPIYLRDEIILEGTELLSDIRRKQGEMTVNMVLRFLEKWPELKPVEQNGDATYFPKRTRDHDKLDTNKSISELFDQFRIVDNERYPAWFEFRGKKYFIKIYHMD
jgi:methionyl-tRNA formyltransferase